MMIRICFSFLLVVATPIQANDCESVVQGYEAKDIMYVLCNDLSELNDSTASELIAKVMGQYIGPPDEIVVYFVGSKEVIGNVNPSSNTLVGFYYTHSNQLTIWPGQENKKRVIEIQ